MRECIFTVILSLLCLGGSLNAAQLTPSQALSRVGVKAHSQQIQSTDADSGVMPQLRLTMEHDGLNTVYVFSRGQWGISGGGGRRCRAGGASRLCRQRRV